MTKDEGKLEVFHAFFASDLNTQTSCSLGTHSTELENKDGERNEVPFTNLDCILGKKSSLEGKSGNGTSC